MSRPRFPVASANYKVKAFNSNTKSFEDVKSTVTCSNDIDALKKPVYSCFLNIEHVISSFEVGFYQVTYTQKSAQDEMKPLQIGGSIGDGGLIATFKGASGSNLVFTVFDADTKAEEELTFSLAYWLSAVN